MRIITSVVAAVLIAVASLGAQQRPDFSGAWVLLQDRSSQTPQTIAGSVVVSVTGLLGDKFSAVQDAKTLALTITVVALGGDIKAVYNLDGSESKNMNPVGGGQPDEPIFSRASWEGDKLVILTRGTAVVNGKVTETRRVMWLDTDGLLTIDRIAEGAPTRRSVYQRSK